MVVILWTWPLSETFRTIYSCKCKGYFTLKYRHGCFILFACTFLQCGCACERNKNCLSGRDGAKNTSTIQPPGFHPNKMKRRRKRGKFLKAKTGSQPKYNRLKRPVYCKTLSAYLHNCLCVVNHGAGDEGARFSFTLAQTAWCMCPRSAHAHPEDEYWLYVQNPTVLSTRQTNASEPCGQSG